MSLTHPSAGLLHRKYQFYTSVETLYPWGHPSRCCGESGWNPLGSVKLLRLLLYCVPGRV
jgi:hypothetical protein